jgi:hypothetical protein
MLERSFEEDRLPCKEYSFSGSYEPLSRSKGNLPSTKEVNIPLDKLNGFTSCPSI